MADDPAPNPAPALTPTAPWHQGVLAPELLGHAQLKGWDISDPVKFSVAAATAHRAAELHLGVPADRIIRKPKDAQDAEGIKAYRAALGVPDAPAGYDLTAIKFADGTDLDPGFADAMRNALYSSGVAKDAAASILSSFVKHLEQSETSEATERAATLANERTVLAQNWGANADVNRGIAQRGAQTLGLTPTEVAALENVAGYAKTMEALRRVGVLSGEDKFQMAPGPTGDSRIMTKDMAIARRQELMGDKTWVQKYSAGDTEAIRNMTHLNELISGQTLADANIRRF